MRRWALSAGLAFFTLFAAAASWAEDFYCEVMAVQGSVLKTNAAASETAVAEGDLLEIDDLIQVGASSSVDIAYDKDWNNVIRVEENSKIKIRSIEPGVVDLDEGGLFATLKSLPKDSTFDVKTPTAIATVRGTEYRTTFAGGQTEVFNVSDSDVYVYGMDEAGTQHEEPVIVKRSEATQIASRGQRPVMPRPMQTHEIQKAEGFRQAIHQKIQNNISQGRVGKIQDIKQMELHRQQRGQTPAEGGRRPVPTMSGDDARNAVQKMREGDGKSGVLRSGEGQVQSSDKKRPGYASGEGLRERKPDQSMGAGSEPQGLGEPFFPGNERKRRGGPEPVGFPQGKWESGSDSNGPEMDPLRAEKIDTRKQRFEDGGRIVEGRQQNGPSGAFQGQQGPQGSGTQGAVGGQKGGGQKSSGRPGANRPAPKPRN